MGTRHLVAVQIDGEYKVAQYGQWDGYPEGAGISVINFARKLNNGLFMSEFKRKVRAAEWITSEEIKKINEDIASGKMQNWKQIYPELSRDTGAEILDVIMLHGDGIRLKDDIEFAADSLFCEWAWVIDLDACTLEGYRGFNDHTALNENDRFYFLKNKEQNEFHGVLLSAKWRIDELPSDEEFIAAFDDED